MKGFWSLDMPNRSGKYWARTRDGLDAGILTVCYDEKIGFFCCEHVKRGPGKHSSFGGEMIAGTSWGGLWWSEPIPKIPPITESEVEQFLKEKSK